VKETMAFWNQIDLHFQLSKGTCQNDRELLPKFLMPQFVLRFRRCRDELRIACRTQVYHGGRTTRLLFPWGGRFARSFRVDNSSASELHAVWLQFKIYSCVSPTDLGRMEYKKLPRVGS